jgi:hypothetical protein
MLEHTSNAVSKSEVPNATALGKSRSRAEESGKTSGNNQINRIRTAQVCALFNVFVNIIWFHTITLL